MKITCFQFEPNICGPNVRARAVFRRMAEQGHTIRIVIPEGPGGAENYYRETGIAVDRLKIRKPVSPRNWRKFALYLLHMPLGVAYALAYLRRDRPDVVHVNGAFDLVPAFATRFARLPLVWHLNDTAPSKPIARILGWIVQRLATRIIVVASAVGRFYKVDMSRADLLFAPVDTTAFPKRDPKGRPSRPAAIGLLANWGPLKGHDNFIEVIQRLVNRGHAVRGRAMGAFLEGQSRYWQPLLARIEDLGLDETIDCTGFIEDPAAALNDIDILLLTSRSEACPMSVLEAMSVGVPVVCFNVGGVEELLGTNRRQDDLDSVGDAGPAGFVVPQGDVESMVARVEQLLSDPELFSRQAKAGQVRARAHFSLEACVAGHYAVYSAAIGQKKGRAIEAA